MKTPPAPRKFPGPKTQLKLVLPDPEAAALLVAAEDICRARSNPEADPTQAVISGAQMAHAIAACAPQLLRAVAEFDNPASPYYTLHIEGIGAGADYAICEIILTGISVLLGTPFQYQQQNDGKLVARIQPKFGMEHTDSSSGRVPFKWHSDDPILPPSMRADYVCLLGHTNRSSCPTYAASVAAALSTMNPTSIGALSESAYEIGISDSFALPGDVRLVSRARPLITPLRNGFPVVSFKQGTTAAAPGSDRRHKQALADFVAALDRVAVGTVVDSGSCLIVKNMFACHARGEVRGDRLLFRTLVKRDLTGFGAANRGRVVFDIQDLLLPQPTAKHPAIHTP